jgi:hypothetical protein
LRIKTELYGELLIAIANLGQLDLNRIENWLVIVFDDLTRKCTHEFSGGIWVSDPGYHIVRIIDSIATQTLNWLKSGLHLHSKFIV